MNYTSIEQSNKLLELGLSPESADMHTEMFEEEGDMISVVIGGKCDKSKRNYGTPIWSVGALLEVIPKTIWKENHTFYQNIYYDHELRKYVFDYKDYQHGGRHMHTTTNPEFYLVIYNMVVWLLENNYIK